MADTLEEFRGSPLQHPQIAPATESSATEQPTPLLANGILAVDDFQFPLPQVDPTTKRVQAASILNLLLIALAASEEKKVRQVLRAAQIEIVDQNGKKYFPRDND